MHTLSISDGTTTVNLISGNALYLAAGGWPLAVSPPQISDLGGRGPYDDVTETITVTATGANAIPDLRNTLRLLDQARRWARGEDVTAVTLRIRIDGSTLTAGVVLHAAILGFVHPITGKEMRFERDPPDDMAGLIEALRAMPA